MKTLKTSHYKLLYKKLIRLRTNPLNNNKFLKLNLRIKKELKEVKDKKTNKIVKKWVYKKIFFETPKLKKKKWDYFSKILIKTRKFFKKFKPDTGFNSYNSSKFASLGNSLKKTYRNGLFAQKVFNYSHGSFLKKYLKKRITKMYHQKNPKSIKKLYIEFFESRLDSVLYKAKFGRSAKHARQLISHGHVSVNSFTEKNSSYILNQGDIIRINFKSFKIIKKILKEQYQERFDRVLYPIAPSYLNINYRTLEIVFDNIKNFDFATNSNCRIDHSAVTEFCYRR